MIENGFVHIPETSRGSPNTCTKSAFSEKANTTIRWIRPHSSSTGSKSRSPARASLTITRRASRYFGCQRVGCGRISLRCASMRRIIAPNSSGILGMSD